MRDHESPIGFPVDASIKMDSALKGSAILASSEIKSANHRVLDLMDLADSIRVRTLTVADRVLGEQPLPVLVADGADVPPGSLGQLFYNIGRLNQFLRDGLDQIARLEQL